MGRGGELKNKEECKTKVHIISTIVKLFFSESSETVEECLIANRDSDWFKQTGENVSKLLVSVYSRVLCHESSEVRLAAADLASSLLLDCRLFLVVISSY